MRIRLLRRWIIACVLALPLAARADGPTHGEAIVIDSDLGLDDLATLALVLQTPDVEIASVVATEGVCAAPRAADHLSRLLHRFNRPDVALWQGRSARQPAPPFRAFAEGALSRVLGRTPRIGPPRGFSAELYRVKGHHSTVVVLGPMTSLAAALRQQPTLKAAIARVVVSGSPEVKDNWNARQDVAAWNAVLGSGLPLTFVVADGKATWPAALPRPPLTSIAAGLLAELLREGKVREHFLQLSLSDELAWLQLLDPALFTRGRLARLTAPAKVEPLLRRLLRDGRQARHPVVFSPRPLPDEALQPDVRRRRAPIVAHNGEVEWRAQLMLNELHQHLGAYSLVGVKMGLRAAELLNAPAHAMEVYSESAAGPPVSCLNDGVIVGSGSTPGRGLFHPGQGGRPGSTRVRFRYNGRQVVLALRRGYQQRIAAAIARLLRRHGLEDPRYWAGVRVEGLEIWDRWHRLQLFDVTEK